MHHLLPSWSGRSILTAGVEKIVHHSKTKEEREQVFNKLNAWKPKLFVNNSDYISNGYISYFKQRIRMHRIDDTVGRIEDRATQNCLISLAGEVFHKDFEPIHLIPSADSTTTKGSCCHPRRAHGIKQWQNADLSIDNESYLFKNIPVALSFVPIEDDQLSDLA
ncbi:hypothetical protein LIER_40802 [Lithospermum erythrorhizon]|uniref:Uncharacterized protein n=1 Tax=Lithospermum erythrorhizon TaxID=34254 RepID=A0AAV3QZS6_LITER